MGGTVRDEKKSDYLKFRVSPSFKTEILTLKERTPGCKNMDLQQFILRLIELGIELEEATTKKISEGEHQIKSHSTAV